MGEEEKLIKEVVDWYNQSVVKNNKVYFTHPLLPFLMNADPFGNTKIQEAHGIDEQQPQNSIEKMTF
jgi:hypothetical protein